MSIASRLAKLERNRRPWVAPADCRLVTIAALLWPGDPIPQDLARCANCGGVHVLIEEPVIVDAEPAP